MKRLFYAVLSLYSLIRHVLNIILVFVLKMYEYIVITFILKL